MSRFVDFTDSEVSELLIALDHRLVEGHAYVYTDVVQTLLDDVTVEARKRGITR